MKMSSPPHLTKTLFALSALFIAGESFAAPVGYASLNGGTTGGAGGEVAYASTGAQINQAMCNRASDDTPLTIYVSGTINHGNTSKYSGSCDTKEDEIQFKGVSNISLIGVGSGAVFDQIGIHLRDTSNIILQNLHIKNVKKSGSPTSNGGDAIGMESGVFNVWVDHCTLEATGGEDDGYDSLLDMKATTQYVTVSYTHYNHSGRGGLMGSSDSDDSNTFVTFHHNYYQDIDSRMPLLRHGTAHSFNNYFNGIAKSGMNPRMGGKIKAEHNHFENAHNPIGTFYTTNMGYWDLKDNIFENVTWSSASDESPAGPNPVSTTSINIPYSYTLDDVNCVRDIVKATAGAGTNLATSDGSCSVDPGQPGSSSSSSSVSSTPDNPSSNSSSSSDAGGPLELGTNLAGGAGADGSSKGSGTSYGNVTDGSLSSYWSPGSTSGQRISIKGLSGSFNTVVIRELNNATTSWRLVNNDNGDVLASGTSLGQERIISGFGLIAASKLNLMIDSANSAPQIAEFEMYNATGTPANSSSVSSSSSVPVASSSSVVSSASSAASVSSSAPATGGEQCDWYGSLYPLCTSTTSGWGWESEQSCISPSTCSSQPAPWGIVGGSSDAPSSASSANSSVNNESPVGDIRAAKIEGFAAYADVTGGQGGPVVTVSTGTQLNAALCSRSSMTDPIVIMVDGTINHGNTSAQGCQTQSDVIELKQTSNISIIGVGTNALFDEIGIHVRDASNIIIQNVRVRNVKKSGSPTSNGGDAIGMESNVDRVWIDHNQLEASGGESDGYDSLLDMKSGVTNVTVSYNLFNDSSRAGLVGSSDSDDENNNITFHHNWYKNIEQRTPLIRHALVHVYNNYWSNPTIDHMFHAINSRMGARALVESNYLHNVNNPLIASDDSSQPGCWETNDDNTVTPEIYYSRSVGDGALVIPEVVNGQLQSTCNVSVPYSVTMDNSADVPTIVMANAGVGKISGNGNSTSSNSSSSSVVNNSSAVSSSSSSVAPQPGVLGSNIADGAGADGSSKGNGTSYGSVSDGNLGTYWSPGSTSGQRISVKGLSGSFNTVIIRELNNATSSWRLVNNDNGAVLASGSSLGNERVISGFGNVSASKVNLMIDSANSAPQIAEFEVYNASGSVGTSSSANNSSSNNSSSDSNNSSSVPASSSSSAPANSSSAPASSSSSAGSSLPDYSGPISNDCIDLATNPDVNWRDTSLQSDQEIVECLAQTLGQPVGYGENARGGYDPNGNSKLTVISKNSSQSVEQQIFDAISDDEPNWIVFDKFDFANSSEVAMYRLQCSNSAVQSHLGATEAECIDYTQWCSKKGISSNNCVSEFFNNALNEGDLPIRNIVVGSNKTLDGRMSEAFFRFNGFAIGRDSSGQPTQTANSVILTHLNFVGAGHTEDHGLDPDMIRVTGASHDVWIHRNNFDTTGDAAFDVKVGAYDVTISFNKLIDVKRASLHGSSDGRTINSQITTTMHHNAFITRDESYSSLGNTLRRIPLIRRGTSHMFNNIFVNYRKDILSIRVGASVLWEDNAFVVNRAHQEKGSLESSLDELQSNLVRDIGGGNFRGEGIYLWFSDAACNIDSTTQRQITESSGSVGNLTQQYSSRSQNNIANWRFDAGQELVDYVSATAGRDGALPFNSPLAGDRYYVLGLGKVACQ